MHILVVSFKNGDVNYFGPFPTLFLANNYAEEIQKEMRGYARHHTVPLIVPFKVSIAWK